MSAYPPGLDEACRLLSWEWCDGGICPEREKCNCLHLARFLAIAARNQRKITEAMVEAAWQSIPGFAHGGVTRESMRAALEAAEKARWA